MTRNKTHNNRFHATAYGGAWTGTLCNMRSGV